MGLFDKFINNRNTIYLQNRNESQQIISELCSNSKIKNSKILLKAINYAYENTTMIFGYEDITKEIMSNFNIPSAEMIVMYFADSGTLFNSSKISIIFTEYALYFDASLQPDNRIPYDTLGKFIICVNGEFVNLESKDKTISIMHTSLLRINKGKKIDAQMIGEVIILLQNEIINQLEDAKNDRKEHIKYLLKKVMNEVLHSTKYIQRQCS